MADNEISTIDVETKAVSILDRAKAIAVVDGNSYTVAGEMWKALGDMMKEVDDGYDAIIKKAHASWKEALARKAKYYDPLETARKALRAAMRDYDEAQARKAREEAAKLEAIARQQEQERRLAEAICMEESGDKEASIEILEEQSFVAPVIVNKDVPKVKGGPAFREDWSFEVTDQKLVPDIYKTVNTVAVNAVVRSLKGNTNIPGIRVFVRKI